MVNRINLLDKKYNYFNWNYKRVLNSSYRFTCANKIKIAILDGGFKRGINFYNEVSSDKVFTTSANSMSDHGLQVVGVIDSLIKGAYIFPYVVHTTYEKKLLTFFTPL